MKDFSKRMGIEPTFYYKQSQLHEKLEQRIRKVKYEFPCQQKILEAITFAHIYVHIKSILVSIGKRYNIEGYIDEGILEIPSPVLNKEEIMKYFQFIVKVMDQYGFVPSSQMTLEYEGGNHISFHVNVADTKFINKLCIFLMRNPSIFYAFLSPYDFASSRIRNVVMSCKGPIRLYKGDAVAYDMRRNRLELRFFRMPLDVKEFEYHLDFSVKLMNYVNKARIETLSESELRTIHISKALGYGQFGEYFARKNHISYETLVENFKNVAELLKMPGKMPDFVKFNRVLP